MPRVARPLVPPYAFNSPREPIRLYDGPIGGFNDDPVDGYIEFKIAPRPEVSWRVNSDNRLSLDFDDLELDIEHSTGRAQMVAHRRSATEGWFEPVALGRAEAELSHVLVHWLNLPAIRSPHGIENPDGTVEYSGRWTAVLGEWSVTMDMRSDHTEVWRQVRAEGSIVMTHVMEIRRVDGYSFTPADEGARHTPAWSPSSAGSTSACRSRLDDGWRPRYLLASMHAVSGSGSSGVLVTARQARQEHYTGGTISGSGSWRNS
jgi:hypothetical protein